MNRRNKLATLTAIAGLTSGIAVMCTGAAGATNTSPVTVTNGASNPVPVNGTVNVGNLPATQQVGGTVNVGNLPADQAVHGTIDVGNFPATQQVGGTVNVGNLPADQQVHGDVGVKDGAPFNEHQYTVNYNGRGGAIEADADSVPSAAYVIETMSVEVSVPTGDHPRVNGGCGPADVYIPVTYQYSDQGHDFFNATIGSLGLACDARVQPFAVLVSYPYAGHDGDLSLDVTWIGHWRN